MSITFTEEEQKVLEEIAESNDDSYILVWPGRWAGTLKFKLVSSWGQRGSVLYHKLREGFQEALAVCEPKPNALQEHKITLKRTEAGTYKVDKIERVTRHHCISQHRIEWSQLAAEARCHWRTVPPPSHFYSRGRAKFEGKKLVTVVHGTSRQTPGKRARNVHKPKTTGMSKEMIDELLRTLAYVAAQGSQDVVNYVTLQRDMMNTRAKNSVLQELGRDIHSYIERTATQLLHNKQSQNGT